MHSKTERRIHSKTAIFNRPIQGGLAHQKCYARVQPGHSVHHHAQSARGQLPQSSCNWYRLPHSTPTIYIFGSQKLSPAKVVEKAGQLMSLPFHCLKRKTCQSKAYKNRSLNFENPNLLGKTCQKGCKIYIATALLPKFMPRSLQSHSGS